MIAGFVSLIAVTVTRASLVWLHVQRTGLSAARNPVSEYGITPFRSGYRIATIAFGIAGIALAIGIDRAISGHGRVGVVALLISALRAERSASSRWTLGQGCCSRTDPVTKPR